MQHAGNVLQDAPPTLTATTEDDAYRKAVLCYDQTEDEVDQALAQTALDLGIKVPPSTPETSLDLVTEQTSLLDIKAAIPEPPPPPSRASESAPTLSESSTDRRGHAKTPSLAADSVTSAAPSTSSASSNKSHYAKIKRRIRRLSTVRRRKALSATVPDLPATPSLGLPPRPSLGPRPATTDNIPTAHKEILQPHALTTDDSEMGVPQRLHYASTTYLPTVYYAQPEVAIVPPQKPGLDARPTEVYSVEEFERPSLDADAISRSLQHPALGKLRTTQLQEQLRFISFQASQNRLMRTAHLQAKRTALINYKARETESENKHVDALSTMEHRHLMAEVDLRNGLEAEKKACETRLKHMQAYCNPRNNIVGMPAREVTQSDYRQLEQQYHLRNTMDNLHTSKINVLREKQARQIERVVAKQEAALAAAEQSFERENRELDVQFHLEEIMLEDEFAARRKRLVRRWELAEMIERRKLEMETGEHFGRLPPIEWTSPADLRSPARTTGGSNGSIPIIEIDGTPRQDSVGQSSVASSGASGPSDDLDGDAVDDDAAATAYCATNMI